MVSSPFDIKTGKPLAEKKYPTYTDAFSKKIMSAGEQYPELVAVDSSDGPDTGVVLLERNFRIVSLMWELREAHAGNPVQPVWRAKRTAWPVVTSSLLQRDTPRSFMMPLYPESPVISLQ